MGINLVLKPQTWAPTWPLPVLCNLKHMSCLPSLSFPSWKMGSSTIAAPSLCVYFPFHSPSNPVRWLLLIILVFDRETEAQKDEMAGPELHHC